MNKNPNAYTPEKKKKYFIRLNKEDQNNYVSHKHFFKKLFREGSSFI